MRPYVGSAVGAHCMRPLGRSTKTFVECMMPTRILRIGVEPPVEPNDLKRRHESVGADSNPSAVTRALPTDAVSPSKARYTNGS